MSYEHLDDEALAIHYSLTRMAALDIHKAWEKLRDQAHAMNDELMRRDQAKSIHELVWTPNLARSAECACGDWEWTDGCGLCIQIHFYEHAGWPLTPALEQHTYSTKWGPG